MRVGRTECGFCLTERAFPASIRLTQCEPKTALYCSSGRSSLRAATIKALEAAYGPAWVNEWLAIRGVESTINIGRAAAAPYTSEKLHESV